MDAAADADADADELVKPLLGGRGNLDEERKLSPEVSPTSSTEYNAAVRNPQGGILQSIPPILQNLKGESSSCPTSSTEYNAAVRNPQGGVLQSSAPSLQDLNGDPSSQSNVFSNEIEVVNPTGSEVPLAPKVSTKPPTETERVDNSKTLVPKSSSQAVPPAATPSPAPCILPLLKQSFKIQNLILALSIFIYFLIGVIVYVSIGHDFSGKETNSIVDGLYFSSVTLCTAGFGDIVPISSFTKGFTVVFALFGIFILNLILELFDKQFRQLLTVIEEACKAFPINSFTVWILDHENRRMRILFKVGLAFMFVLVFNGIGTLTLFFTESLSWTDSFYGSMISSMTVGYGNVAFCTMIGRFFAFIWLLLSTIAVAEFFLILMEARQSMVRNQILKREITMEDLVEAHLVKLHPVQPGFVRFVFSFSLI
ncbi:hypothetical protein AAC387_Pa10g2101 [Persea americana]